MAALSKNRLALPRDEFHKAEIKRLDEGRDDLLSVIDEASADATIAPMRYDITSYGASYDVEGLVKRVKRGDIYVPTFQRGYVWEQPRASQFIESLLLGLPVSGIFLAREWDSNKFIVIDGQQRLKTLLYFYDGLFEPKGAETGGKVFRLTKVQPEFEGSNYNSLREPDRIRLNDSILHATIVKPESPDGEASLYSLFDRLNTGGMKVAPQEIRAALYQGDMMNLVRQLNHYEGWRELFGRQSLRLKDEEMVLRFLALHYDSNQYQPPMAGFLNRFAQKHRKANPAFLEEAEYIFKNTIATMGASLGRKAFRPEGALNAAVFDSVMVGLARQLTGQKSEKTVEINNAYERLLDDSLYHELISRSTSSAANVKERIEKAEAEFSNIK